MSLYTKRICVKCVLLVGILDLLLFRLIMSINVTGEKKKYLDFLTLPHLFTHFPVYFIMIKASWRLRGSLNFQQVVSYEEKEVLEGGDACLSPVILSCECETN